MQTLTQISPEIGHPVSGSVQSEELVHVRSRKSIEALAEGAGSPQDRLAAGIDIIARNFESPFVSMHVDIHDENIEYFYHHGDIPAQVWKPLCSELMQACLSTQVRQASFFIERTHGAKTAILAVPACLESSGSVGAVCMAVPADSAEFAKRIIIEFEGLVSTLLNTVVGSKGKSPATPKADFLTRICDSSILDNLTQFAFHLVNDLSNQFKCLQVSFGIVTENRVKLLAISGYSKVSRRSPGCIAIEQAMTETLDAGHSILLQDAAAILPVRDRINCVLHQVLRSQTGNSSYYSLALRHQDKVFAVCTFQRGESEPFSEQEISLLESFQEQLAQYTMISVRLSQSVWSRLWEKIRQKLGHGFFSVIGRKWIFTAILLGFCLYLILPWPHSITIPCTLVSADNRTYSAPFSGRLRKAHFRNGDRVTRGSVLFEMDTEELQHQKLKLLAELASQNQAMIRFLLAGDTAKAGEHRSLTVAMRQELATIESRIDQSTARAHEDGTIIESNLHQRLGESIALGERLFGVATNDSQQVELRIPDYLGMEFQVGQRGHYATAAEPNRWRDLVLQRVEMASTTENGENFIKAIGLSSQIDPEARIGLSGFARISVGNQSGWWILFQRPIRYIQRKVSQL
jgi:hypothetical protein